MAKSRVLWVTLKLLQYGQPNTGQNAGLSPEKNMDQPGQIQYDQMFARTLSAALLGCGGLARQAYVP